MGVLENLIAYLGNVIERTTGVYIVGNGEKLTVALVTELVERDGVVVHPGYFFDFPHEAFLVVSLLPEPGEFARGVRLVQERLDAA